MHDGRLPLLKRCGLLLSLVAVPAIDSVEPKRTIVAPSSATGAMLLVVVLAMSLALGVGCTTPRLMLSDRRSRSMLMHLIEGMKSELVLFIGIGP